jgi:hypothetical protein
LDAIIAGLINTGGLGLFAAAMFWLHNRTIDKFEKMQDKAIDRFDAMSLRSLGVFEKEMQAERSNCLAMNTAVLVDLKEQRHAIKDVGQSVAIMNSLMRVALKLPEVRDQAQTTGD